MDDLNLNELQTNIQFECLIAITRHGTGYIIDWPDKYENFLDGDNTEDNNLKEIPAEMGIYKCIVKYIFHQGYLEGYICDSESDWEFEIIKSEKCLLK